MHNIKKKVLYILLDNNIYSLLFILFLSLLNTVLEVVGIGLIIPILGIFVGQGYEKYLQLLPFFSDFSETKILLLIFVVFNLIYFLKFLTSVFTIYLRNKFCWNLNKNLSEKIFYNYINKDYLLHMSTHSSERLNTIRGESNLFSFGVITPIIDLIIDFILLVSICVFLLFYNIQLSFFVIIFFLLIGFLWNNYYNKYLDSLGKMRESHAKGAIKEIQNSFGNFRETIIFGLRKLFLKRFQLHNREFSSIGIKRDTIIQIPRFLLELLSVTGILLIFFILVKNNLQLSEIIVLLGVFVFATLRTLPSVTKIIRSIQIIKFNNIVITKIYDQVYDFKNFNKEIENKNNTILNFKNLSIKKLNFEYPNSDNLVLKNLYLNISRGDKIGIIGKTGSGKSTLINIIAGLINTDNKELEINDQALNQENVASWQSKIGYVPHDVFLLDETIGYNVSLKQEYKDEKKEILDILDKVELLEFVKKQPKTIETLVGENGSKLSRGQTQRLGIARALYTNPQILIFDEATSALDVITEKKILTKLYDKSDNLTIISISHRKSALEFCDRVLEINDGNIKEIV